MPRLVGDGRGSMGCGLEGPRGYRLVPGFALEYVELISVWWLHGGSTCFPSWVGSDVYDWGLHVGSPVSGCCAFCGRVSVWSGGVALTGFVVAFVRLCWGVISVGGTNVVCVVLGHVTGRVEGLGQVDLGMFV